MAWVLYLLECQGNQFYAGITNNLDARFEVHVKGKGAKFTRAFKPIRIIASMPFPDRSSASIAEAALKRLPKALKPGYFEQSMVADGAKPIDLVET